MKRFLISIVMLYLMTATGWASTGWPAKYSGVMLQLEHTTLSCTCHMMEIQKLQWNQ